MIKIATWNMCYWQHQKSFSDSWDFLLDRINPDIALVQETIPHPTLRILKYFVWQKIGGKRDWGSGIFSRYPVEEVDFDNNYQGSVFAGKITLPNDMEFVAISIESHG